MPRLTPTPTQPALVEHLRRTWAQEELSFHMPGHKAGNGAPELGVELLGRAVYEADVSELGGFDYLHEPRSGIAAAQAQAAALLGAEHSWFLINGASVGNVAAICSTVADGEGLLVARDSHRSVYAGIAISGARPVYLRPVRNERLDGLFGIDPRAVQAALARDPGIRAVHVTSPNSYGFTVPMDEIAAIAARHGVPLIADEAHGTHFALHPDLPRHALAYGADVVVHSPHKSLGALTQAALLHHQGELVDPARISRNLQMLQSSSPSAPLLISLAVALDAMASGGHELWGRVLALAGLARQRLAATGLVVHGADVALSPGIGGFDPTKLTVDVSALGMTGFAAARWLQANRAINPESSDLRRLVFALTVGDREASVDLLGEALAALAAADRHEPRPGSSGIVSMWPAQIPAAELTPRLAAAAPNAAVAIGEAVGAVSAEMIVPYPPGVPLIVGGEVISAETVASVLQLLDHGCRMVGMSDPSGSTLRCMVRSAREG